MPTPIQLVYASTSGNTEIVMETVAHVLQNNGFNPFLHRAEQTSIAVIQENALFIFGTSTWEHGALNPFFRRLLTEMKEQNLAGKVAAFAGCGDKRYEPVLFCEGIEKVKKVWIAQGGSVLGETLKINGEPYGLLRSDVTNWAEDISHQVTSSINSSSGKKENPMTKVRSLLGF